MRIGLIVGISGGAPAKHDIRLGDIVVSSPGYVNGGVFRYDDYRRIIQDKSFTTTGNLNQPPILMLTALMVLKAIYESDGHNIDDNIQTISEKKPRLRSNIVGQTLQPINYTSLVGSMQEVMQTTAKRSVEVIILNLDPSDRTPRTTQRFAIVS
ncbi:hypothetical protein F5B21DRAFT_505788 [Xylaria acuta]|nr:hypothetical protein F5B21DRAFT_505788 [Xylaria acuta]